MNLEFQEEEKRNWLKERRFTSNILSFYYLLVKTVWKPLQCVSQLC